MFYMCHYVLYVSYEKHKCNSGCKVGAQFTRCENETLSTTPDLSWSCVVFWAPRFKGLPVEECLRTERWTIKGLEYNREKNLGLFTQKEKQPRWRNRSFCKDKRHVYLGQKITE